MRKIHGGTIYGEAAETKLLAGILPKRGVHALTGSDASINRSSSTRTSVRIDFVSISMIRKLFRGRKCLSNGQLLFPGAKRKTVASTASRTTWRMSPPVSRLFALCPSSATE
ncbi:hypothetical protein [Rhodoblastus acidophilus]|uniref:hypothetical protein n=1 Tax=Rhodoblastus acidophilus TaxID=1074 RepID=UPI003CD02E01